MDFVKEAWNIEISKQEPKKKSSAFFVGVWLFSFLFVIFSTHFTLHCLKCLFHLNNHIDKVENVMFVEKVLIWNMTSENISKKTLNLFRFQVGDINISNDIKKSKSLSNGQFFQLALLILYFPNSLCPLSCWVVSTNWFLAALSSSRSQVVQTLVCLTPSLSKQTAKVA